MKISSAKDGYTFMLSVLFIGAVGAAVSGSMLLLSWLSLRNSMVIDQSNKAFEMSMRCAEHALYELYEDENYSGDESFNYGNESCNILLVGGAGNENRTVCTEGSSFNTTRRLEIIIERILPGITIFSWQEVEFFSSCVYS